MNEVQDSCINAVLQNLAQLHGFSLTVRGFEVSKVEEVLLVASGGSPLLSLDQLAGVLHRSADGLRLSLAGDTDVSRKFLPYRKKIGRRVYFEVAGVAKAIEEAVA